MVDARAHPPVLFLAGAGLTTAIGLRWIAELQAHFRILGEPLGAAADGDGADAAAGQDVAVTAVEDAVALLDGAGVDQAHVVGLSFGGVIAQEIAIRHPRRVCSLVLGATSAGGELYARPDAEIPDFIRRLSELPAEEGLWAAVPYLYAPATRRHRAPHIGEDIAQCLRRPVDPRSYRHQHATARAHDASARLVHIAAPTLVMHGEQDRIVPLDNGRRLADGIAGAQFTSVPGGAHAFPTDVPEASRELVSFLRAHSRPPRSSAATRTARAGPA
jgi:pimeloyl-ACP methyl ester carboxylesterase